MTCASGRCGPFATTALEQVPYEQSVVCNSIDRCSDEENFVIDQAYKDACCSTKEPGHPAITKSASYQDSYCSGPSEQAKVEDYCDSKTEMEDGGCAPPEISRTGRQNGCCGRPTKEPRSGVGCQTSDNKVDDDCCIPKCEKSSRSAPEPPGAEDQDSPICCRDKVYPCCDVSCLDRIALRECENQKPAASDDTAPKSKCLKATISSDPTAYVANLQLLPDPAQAQDAAEVETGNHVVSTLVPLVRNMRLP